MKEDLENRLYKKYPELFQEKDLSIQESCMPWGMEIGDGWYWIMDTLCESITVYCKNNKLELPTFKQVKEKFGELRVYNDSNNDIINGMIFLAELQSLRTCEKCGSHTEDVNRKGRSYMITLCKKCRKKLEK